MEHTALKAELPLSPDRIEFLEETGRALGRAIELTAVAKVALEALVPSVADMAVLVVSQREGPPHVAVTHARPNSTLLLEREVREALDAILSSAARNAQEGRHSHWIPNLSDETARFLTREDPRLHSLIETAGLHSLIVVSLRSGGRTIGGLALGRAETPTPFHSADFATVQVLARRISLAIDSAMLQEHLQQHLNRAPAVAEALDKWVRVFDVAWWGAAIVDGVDHRIEAVNPAFARLHGHAEPDTLVGRPFAELVPTDRTGEIQQWKLGSEGLVYESEHRRSDGSVVPVLVSVTPLYDDRRPGSYVVTVQDLSDLKRAEERLRRAQRMEAVGRLAGGVAHEVNNMMTIILGFSDLLSQEGAAEGQQREVEEIRKAALRAGKITSQLLAFSRQQVLQPSDLRLNAVVEEMAAVLRLMLPANVRVETALSPLDTVVRVDRSQIEQVLINLAFNARDAMVSGGTIRLVTESRRLDEDAGRRLIGIPIPPGSYGLISVIDTGHGMDAATLAHVFEPFFTTKPVGSGTRLGLSTVYGIVKQSGGYVWAESTPGQGTTFTICLPEVSGAAGERPAVPQAIPEPRASGETVLVLEDEDGVRELTARVLRDRGYEVVPARNGSEALAKLREGTGTHDLLLTDVIVPDMGTEQLEWEVHRILPGLPILYMSGYPKDDILARGLLRADQPFLQKPFTGEDLAAEVGRMIQRA
ncbi:MAG TPA: ATP-binding protein [Gemmatimonadales bacterium]|nr:ATP-binding protein [Gemmatimonadales bacterium]